MVILIGKGQIGFRTNGVTANFVFLTEGLLGYSRQPTFYLPRSASPYLFSPICQKYYFCSGPISADPICPQPSVAIRARPCCEWHQSNRFRFRFEDEDWKRC